MKVGDCVHLTGDLKTPPPTKQRYRLKENRGGEGGEKSRGAVGKKREREMKAQSRRTQERAERRKERMKMLEEMCL